MLAIVCKHDIIHIPQNHKYTTYTQLHHSKGKGSPCSIAKCRVPELIPVLGSQPAGDVNHKPDGRLPLLSATVI